MDAIKAPSLSNILADIVVLVSTISNIKFGYCNRYANTLVDTITRKANHCNVQTVLFIDNIFPLCCFKKREKKECTS